MTREEILKHAFEYYGTSPEYLWDSSPDSAVLRNKSGKWYAIIMNVKNKSLGFDTEGTTEVINVKCDPLLIGSLRMQKGFLPAYHMNKNSWISIIIDEKTDNGMLFDLLDMSYELTS